MYQIKLADGTILYDAENPDDYTLTEPLATLEMGQPGSLQFTLLSTHPSYDDIQAMESYVSAFREGTEIFYGRVIDVNVNEITEEKEIQCAGALEFLEDGELAPMGSAEEPTVMTGDAFFRECIRQYNADIGDDARRALTVGTVRHSKSNVQKEFRISSYTKTKQALETHLIGEFGGYLRVRKSGNGHVVDWIEDYQVLDDSPIQLAENVVSQENAISGQDFFTFFRPVGKDGLLLSGGGIPLSQALINKYGKIVKSVTFSSCETEEQLSEEAHRYLGQIGQGLGKSANINVVDMHFLDNATPSIKMGAVYTNIFGFEGENMTAFGVELHFAHPENDTVTFKNDKEILPSSGSSRGGYGSASAARGSFARAMGGGSGGGFQNVWQHISETEDTLTLYAKEIGIHAERLEETATEFERLSRETGDSIDGIRGTAVFQGADHITQIAGLYRVRYYVVSQAKLSVPNKNPHNAGYYDADNYFRITQEMIDAWPSNPLEVYSSTGSALAGERLVQGQLRDGMTVTRMVMTSDATVDPNALGENPTRFYYTKSLDVLDGAGVTIDSDGQKVTVVDQLMEYKDGIQQIQGSALWTRRSDIVAVSGAFHIEGDPERIVIDAGGGMKIQKDGVEYGLYDEDTLTAGLIVEKLSDGVDKTTIKGDYINIEAVAEQVGATLDINPEEIKAAVAASQSTFYAQLLVSISGIETLVVNKPMVFRQWSEPVGTPERALAVGDIWIKTQGLKTWSEMQTKVPKWNDLQDQSAQSPYKGFDWKSARGAQIYTYDGNQWVLSVDETVLASSTDVEQTEDHWQVTAQKIEMIEGERREHEAQLRVEADQIRSKVEEKIQGIGSQITQTAEMIRSEVYAQDGRLSSSIEQTASYVRTKVTEYDTAFGTMTGMIEVQSDKISLVVETKDNGQHVIKAAKIITEINKVNDGLQSRVYISADVIDLDGLVKTQFITSDYVKARIESLAELRVKGNLRLDGILKVYGSTSDGDLNLYTLNYDTMGTMVKSIKLVGNELQIVRFDGVPINFSKATTLSLSWDSSSSSVKATSSPAPATPAYYQVGVRFNSNPPSSGTTPEYVIQAMHSSGSGTSALSGTDVKYRLGRNGATVQIENMNGNRISNTPTLTVPLQQKTIYSSGTYSPDSSYAGFSSVTVSVPSITFGYIDVGEIAVSPYPPSGYEAAVHLSQLQHAIHGNRYTNVYFSVRAFDAYGGLLDRKTYYVASAS